MKHLKIHIFFTLLILGISACQEDTIDPDVFGTLTGQVLLAEDNSVVAGATISTTPATSTVQSDAEGSFVLEGIKVGSYTVRAEKSDLVSAVETISIFEDKTSNVVILMSVAEDINTPPNAPNSPFPSDGALKLPINLELDWEASDPNENDQLTYDVMLFSGEVDADTLVANGLIDNNLEVENLRYATTYFWQVAVNDGSAEPVYSEVWRFRTEDFPLHPFVFSKVENGIYEIYCAQQANETYQLTTGGSNYRPRFSPAGNLIAFVNSNFPQKQLFVMDRDGKNVTLVEAPIPLAADNDFELDFCWSPDGTKLLYMNEESLFKINVDGTGFEVFAELAGEEFIEVDWNGPTGKIAARAVGSQPFVSRILLYEEDGTFVEEVVPDVPGSIGGPSFSIDGNFLLYTRDTTGFESPDGRQLESHVFLKNLETGEEQDLSVDKPLGFNDLDARFSPNGALVIFVQTNNFPNSQKDIYLMNLDGNARTLLFENAEMPDWWD